MGRGAIPDMDKRKAYTKPERGVPGQRLLAGQRTAGSTDRRRGDLISCVAEWAPEHAVGDAQ